MQAKRTDIQDIQINVDTSEKTNLQVKPTKQKTTRRKFTIADKRKILNDYDALNDSLSRGAFLRKNSLYSSTISKWREHVSGGQSSRAKVKTDKLIAKNNQVLRENAALKKKFAQAEAIIDLQKKVSELLSTHILPPEMSEKQ